MEFWTFLDTTQFYLYSFSFYAFHEYLLNSWGTLMISGMLVGLWQKFIFGPDDTGLRLVGLKRCTGYMDFILSDESMDLGSFDMQSAYRWKKTGTLLI